MVPARSVRQECPRAATQCTPGCRGSKRSEQLTVSGQRTFGSKDSVLNVGTSMEDGSRSVGPVGPRNDFAAPSESLQPPRQVRSRRPATRVLAARPAPGGPIGGGYVLAPNKLYSVPPVIPREHPAGPCSCVGRSIRTGWIRQGNRCPQKPVAGACAIGDGCLRRGSSSRHSSTASRSPVQMVVTVVFDWIWISRTPARAARGTPSPRRPAPDRSRSRSGTGRWTPLLGRRCRTERIQASTDAQRRRQIFSGNMDAPARADVRAL